MLANQQEDGDGLLQNIVTNLGKGSRKGLTDGLGESNRVDSDRALDVGALRQGTGTSKIRTPKVPEGGSDVTVRESPDELTSRDYGGTEVGQEISIGVALDAETVFPTVCRRSFVPGGAAASPRYKEVGGGAV